MSRFPSPQVTLRDANKIATTNMHNELAAAILAQQPPFITGHHRPQNRYLVAFVGKVTDKGPKNEADYKDPRYFVQREYIPAAGFNDLISLKDDTNDPSASDRNYTVPTNPNVYTVTNLPEVDVTGNTSGTHALWKDLLVYVFADNDVGTKNSPALPHYVMCVVPPDPLRVTCTSDGGSGSGAATFTYTIKRGTTTLNTLQTPDQWRPAVDTTAATYGYAHFDTTTGKYKLEWCNEKPSAAPCS